MPYKYLSPDRITLCEALPCPDSGVIICDTILAELYPQAFDKSLPIYRLEATEANKSWDTLGDIYRFLAEQNVRRSDVIQVIGGGITCDIAAFAAATFKRGCRLKLYPTTLLAMIDAAIGGKSAINFQAQRNLIGSFYPAEEILLYPGFLPSLPSEELRQGIAEMLKTYLINPHLSAPKLQPDALPEPEQILEYAHFKLGICREDPFDTGIRRLLNLGHTYAHAYETILDYRYKHGDMVIMGIYSEIEQSRAQGYLPEADYLQIKELLAGYPLPTDLVREVQAIDAGVLARSIQQDKKMGGKMPVVTGFRCAALFQVAGRRSQVAGS